MALRLLFYDDTCRESRFGLGLTHSWITGATFYSATGKFHAALGVRRWIDALEWLATYRRDEPIAEIQYWGHGKWGRVLVDRDSMTADWLDPGHEFHPLLTQIRDRMAGPDALWWFRTCETFGAEIGHDFARRWTSFFECQAAGHTYIIGPLQSGLHSIRAGESPTWSAHEGIEEGEPDNPRKALWSVPGAPNTISCLRATLPTWAASGEVAVSRA
jgi:hypothetical protein